MNEGNFWLTTVLTVTVLMIPVLAWRFYFVDVFPTLSDRVRLKQRLAQLRSRQSQDVLRTPSARRTRRSIRSGYAFAHQEGFGRLITSGKIMRKLPRPNGDFLFPMAFASPSHAANASTRQAHCSSSNASSPQDNGAAMTDSGINLWWWCESTEGQTVCCRHFHLVIFLCFATILGNSSSDCCHNMLN